MRCRSGRARRWSSPRTRSAYGKPRSIARSGARIVTVDGKRGLPFGALTAASIDAAVAERRLHITADTPAKILFTSGSTGLPKGVLNTHGNLAVGRRDEPLAGRAARRRTASACRSTGCPGITPGAATPTSTASSASAGSLYIDGGRPLPGRFQETLENLRELSPSGFATVPAAYPLLLEALERDEDLRAKFFKNLRGLGYGGALLPQESFDRLQGLADRPARRAPAVRLRLGHDRDHQRRPDGLLERRPLGASGPAAAQRAGQAGAGR